MGTCQLQEALHTKSLPVWSMQCWEEQAVQPGICIWSRCQKVGMNGLVYFLESQFLWEDIILWMRKSFNPGVLGRMVVRCRCEGCHLFPRYFQLDMAFVTSALEDVRPPAYRDCAKLILPKVAKFGLQIQELKDQNQCIWSFPSLSKGFAFWVLLKGHPLALPEALSHLYTCDVPTCPSLLQVKAETEFKVSYKVMGIGAALGVLLLELEQKKRAGKVRSGKNQPFFGRWRASCTRELFLLMLWPSGRYWEVAGRCLTLSWRSETPASESTLARGLKQPVLQ